MQSLCVLQLPLSACACTYAYANFLVARFSEDFSWNFSVWLTYYGINILKNFHTKSHHHTIEINLNLRNKICYITKGFDSNLVWIQIIIRLRLIRKRIFYAINLNWNTKNMYNLIEINFII